MNNKQLQIVLIGCGSMGSAILKGWLLTDLQANIHVVTRDYEVLANSPLLKGVHWHNTYHTVPSKLNPDVIVIAVKPDQVADVLQSIQKIHLSSCVLISVAAGIESEAYYQIIPPTTALARVMPNLAVELHEGMSVAYFTEACLPEQTLLVEKLFQKLGKISAIKNESDFHLVTVLSGCGPAYVCLLEEAMISAAQRIGISTQMAQLLTRQTIIGAAKMLHNNQSSAQDLIDNITSANGVTEAALDILTNETSGLNSLMGAAFSNALQRSRELA